MESAPDGVEIGDTLSKSEIEDAFDTGFGYRISGINPRRDDQDRRYILLFASEDGPYNDSVTQERFEYIGEGLDGDQSENSPGNSALIDAQSSEIPVHFFYQEEDSNVWEYQGIVDIVDYSFREETDREVIVYTVEYQRHPEAEESPSGSEESSLDEYPDAGETFTAEVDRISSSGNGIVETQEGHINIGPVTKKAVGREITAKMDQSNFARCTTESVLPDNYETQYNYDLLGKANAASSSSVASGSLPPVAQRGSGEENSTLFCKKCGSVLYLNEDGSRVCSSCGYKKSSSPNNASKQDSAAAKSDSIGNNRYKKELKDSKDKIKSEESIGEPSSGQTELASSDTGSNSEIDELRQQAMEDAVEQVPKTASTVQHEASTYNRSHAVKQYVKARANGICEGCGEPAPFTSKTGKPYLHAHHIHELSDGGSDTPDTVVAICPNCHYRVHHGQDGDEYNQELFETIQKKENSNE